MENCKVLTRGARASLRGALRKLRIGPAKRPRESLEGNCLAGWGETLQVILGPNLGNVGNRRVLLETSGNL